MKFKEKMKAKRLTTKKLTISIGLYHTHTIRPHLQTIRTHLVAEILLCVTVLGDLDKCVLIKGSYCMIGGIVAGTSKYQLSDWLTLFAWGYN